MNSDEVIFTMRNEGFQTAFVAPYCKAILVTIIFDDVLGIKRLFVIGIPLTAIKMLTRQNIPHLHREEVPERVLRAIERDADQRIKSITDKMEESMMEARRRMEGATVQ